ncbi:hypothetical protein ACG83_00740 [Frankia sp. R43]|nr:hypothetical protein ACG83_00740 [Frankia sp. R43]
MGSVCPFAVERPASIQRWERLTFLHWPFEPEVVRRRLPPELTVDTFDGQAWVSLVPFSMRVATGRGWSLPWMSAFPETNVRTYVVDRRGRRGVWFFSLDAARLPAVLMARGGFRLPYLWSAMRVVRTGEGWPGPRRTLGQDGIGQDGIGQDGIGQDGIGQDGIGRDRIGRDGIGRDGIGRDGIGRDEILYRTRRRWPGPRGASSRVRVRIGAAYQAGELSPLDHFLTARWRLYSSTGPSHRTVPACHEPWPLHRADPVELDDGLLGAAGLAPPAVEPLMHYSPGVQVRIGRPERYL